MPSTLIVDVYLITGQVAPGITVTVLPVTSMLEVDDAATIGIVHVVSEAQVTGASGIVSFDLLSSDDYRVPTQYLVEVGHSKYVITLPSGRRQLYDLLTPTSGDHNRYLALSDDTTFTTLDYTGGTVFQSNIVTFPTFTTPKYPGITVPATSPITTFTQLGAIQQDLSGFFDQAADIDIGGTNHQQWVGNRMFPAVYSGVRLRVT